MITCQGKGIYKGLVLATIVSIGEYILCLAFGIRQYITFIQTKKNKTDFFISLLLGIIARLHAII